ncbi:hypothetical protein EX30DRAFT_351882 [Ascodesmis nigricans]|uniref:Uncharacterized protein n=1 Tax=Ascodesmis nigricans TaxID=341454 RepID=A0A4V3SHS2_9PEZI|nr:hypothetical protein EX30DRAFT_351882 [Ascodesmis nigricans]
MPSGKFNCFSVEFPSIHQYTKRNITGTKQFDVPINEAPSLISRLAAKSPSPTELGTFLWPGKVDDCSPIFLLSMKGVEDLGTVIDCLGAYGVHYGAIHFRFPPVMVTSTDIEDVKNWFPVTKGGMRRRFQAKVAHQNHWPTPGSSSGGVCNLWNDSKRPQNRRAGCDLVKDF